MSDIAIQVENLSKLYRIGERQASYKTFRDTLAELASAPFRRLHKDGPAPDSTIWALKDVSFEVKQGEVLGIIGRNGSGKTTLLKILSRITEPTEGHAEIHGRVASLLEVGTGFHPELTGRENIYLNGAILGMRRREIDSKFDEIVEFAELEKFLDTPVKRYSSGMYMRLAFAVAAHLEPEILLVDEVLAVGDAQFQRKCLGKMGEVARQGRTVLFVSHNMAAVRSLCSWAFVLSQGKIQFSGSADESIYHYLLAAGDDLPAQVNTATAPRPAGVTDDSSLRIASITLDTPSGLAILHTGQPITVILEFYSVQPLEDVVFGWSIHSSDGIRIFECRSSDTYGPITQLPPGRYSLRCTLPNNPLNPGFYTLHAGARCIKKGLDYLPDIVTFRVDSTEQFDSLWLELPSGLTRVKSEWDEPTCIPNSVGAMVNNG